MRTSARAVVIGGGIAGCSALYHLTREGWSDVMLLERDELTSGTTWHSAAQVTNFGAIQVMVGLKTQSIRLYKELAEDPDYPINYHHGDGGLRLATEDWHIEGYRHFQSLGRAMGVAFELIDAEEAARRHPLISPHGLKGALWDPLDGDIDPAQLCQALARRARLAGAEVHRHTPVTALTQRPSGDWSVETPAGEILAEHVVNAGGYRCNEIAAMMGVELPVASMEHQYFLTEPIPAIAEAGHRMPLIRCPGADFYARQEKQGLLVGFYEQDCRSWGLGGIDPGFTMALCPDDADRVLPVLEGAVARLPCLAETGIHTIINGPITYTPDGVPLVGRVPGRRGAWAITGLRAGLGEGGGHGRLLAQMMVHGQAEMDTWALDPRRFGAYASEAWTAIKAVEDYQNEFRFHRPHEHRPAGRGVRTSPVTPRLEAAGAALAPVDGWERAAFYRPEPSFEDIPGFGWTPAERAVAAEVRAVSTGVGLMEVSGFTRIEIDGPGAGEWLDGLIAGRMPARPGRVALAYTLTDRGDVLSEATIAWFEDDRFWWGAAAAAARHDLDWLSDRLPRAAGLCLTPLTDSHTCLVIAGPCAAAVLASAAPRTDWAGFPWLDLRPAHIGPVACTAMAVSYSGERAWELHVPLPQSALVYDILCEHGAPQGLCHFGMRAAEAMRIEKGYRHWKADLIDEADPFESDLGRFVRLEKPAFPGRDALIAKQNRPPRHRFVSLRVASPRAPAHPGDAILSGERVVGSVTSAAWGHRVGENLAMGFVAPEHAEPGSTLDLLVLGDRLPAEVVAPCRYDPANARVRV